MPYIFLNGIKDLYSFNNDLEKFIYGIVFKLVLERNISNKALLRVNAWTAAVANDCKIKIRDNLLWALFWF